MDAAMSEANGYPFSQCERRTQPPARYVWSDAPERHLADWANSSDDHAVTYEQIGNLWICTASDLEPCARGKVRHLTRGRGATRAAAADVVLTRIAEKALEREQSRLGHANAPSLTPTTWQHTLTEDL